VFDLDSTLIPTHNAELKCIKEAIRFTLSQTIENKEIIMDDMGPATILSKLQNS
jgi:hypothetical protein